MLSLFVAAYAKPPNEVATPFWIRCEPSAPKLDRTSLGNQHPVFNELLYTGLANRTISRNLSGLTKKVTAVRITDLGLHVVKPRQDTRGYVLAELLPKKEKATRTKAQSDLEYDKFAPRHVPQSGTVGKKFWIRSTAKVVDELDTGDFDTSDVTSFPYGHEIFNGLPFNSLQNKMARSKQYGLERSKQSKRSGDYVLEHGYNLVRLKPRQLKPRVTR